MSIKSDKWIRDKALNHGMIQPFVQDQVRYKESTCENCKGQPARGINAVTPCLICNRVPERLVSFGVSSYGYDIRAAPEFKIFTNINSAIVDPKHFNESTFIEVNAESCLIPPNSFALARSVEYFKIPKNVLVVCLGKSTYARCGIVVNVTPLEPEWEGQITLEFSNTTPLPAKIYANEGVAQLLFFESDEQCETTYRDRSGKYQGQTGITLPKP
jgi:dCTP deaminase